MVSVHVGCRFPDESGQSLIETALVLPFLLFLTLNAINFGYFFFAALNVAAAPRTGVEFAVQGPSTQTSTVYPQPGPGCLTPSLAPYASDVAYNDMLRVLPNSSSATMQVCSQLMGFTNPNLTTQTANCCNCTDNSTCSSGSGSFPSPASDPESPNHVLHRVDVKYTVQPLIPISIFGIQLLPNLTFHRQVSMRAM
jgi:TadE-like protein